MHGIIFGELKKYVDQKHGKSTWEDILNASGIGPKSYLQSKEYDDREAMAIISAASKVNGLNESGILEDFGEFIAPALMKMYSLLIKPEWKTLDLIEHTEETIHKIIRVRDPLASPPALACTRLHENEVTVRYASHRKMCPLLKGIAKGIARHYNERVLLSETECMHNGSPHCLISVKLSSSEA